MIPFCTEYTDFLVVFILNRSIIIIIISSIIIIISVVRLSPLRTAATTAPLYHPRMIDDGDCVAVSAMKIGTGNRSTRRKAAPAPLCPPQIPHEQTRART
jgi:hypothetical protein